MGIVKEITQRLNEKGFNLLPNSKAFRIPLLSPFSFVFIGLLLNRNPSFGLGQESDINL